MSSARMKELIWAAAFAVAVAVAAWGRWELGDWKAELAVPGGRAGVRPRPLAFAAFVSGLLVVCTYAARRLGTSRADKTRLIVALLFMAALSLTVFLGKTWFPMVGVQ